MGFAALNPSYGIACSILSLIPETEPPVLKIYGQTRSRTFRVLWLCKESNITFEQVPISIHVPDAQAKEEWYVKLNPNARIPSIDDDGFVMWESGAINLYLAKKYGAGGLYPSRIEDEARAWQWSFWGMTEVERPVLTAMMNRAVYPEEKRDKAAADAAERALAQPLKVLDGALGRSPNLLGEGFTVADLNVASILAWARPAQIDMSAFPKLAEWLKNCAERPAARAARQMQRE